MKLLKERQVKHEHNWMSLNCCQLPMHLLSGCSFLKHNGRNKPKEEMWEVKELLEMNLVCSFQFSGLNESNV